jgi:hypothetical protein
MRFLENVDTLSARDREAARRQQQAALDKQMAGLVTPGSAPNFAGAAAAPQPEQFPKAPGLAPLAEPAPGLSTPAARKPGLSTFPSEGTTPGYEVTGTPGPKAGEPPTLTQETFRELPAAEQQKVLEEARRKRGGVVSMGPFVGPAPALTAEEFVKTLPTREQVVSQQELDRTGKGDFAPAAAPTPAAGLNTAGAQPAPLTAPAGAAATAAPSSKLQSHLNRATKIPSVVGSKKGQDLIRRASELGVDPAAAIALAGIETDFGANVSDSVQGAQGILQVMPNTFKSMKAFFTNPDIIAQYNIPETLVTAAQEMTPGSLDAGLLRLKYNELIGVPKNLWGAAYQANAEKVRDAGSPLSISDGNGFSNTDYNTAYVALYNEARNYVDTPLTVGASPATNATFNLERLDREQQVYQTTYDNTLTALKGRYDQVAAQRQRITQQMQFAQQNGFYNRLPEFQRQLDTLDAMVMDVNNQANELNTTYQTGVEEFNLKRINEFASIALFRMESGDGAPLSEMWSRATGQDIQLQLAGETYNIYVNGQLTETGVSAGDVRGMFMNEFSQEYAAQQAALREKIAEEKYKADKEIAIEQLKQVGALTLEKLKQAKPEWGELKEQKDINGNTTGYVAIEKGTGRVIRMRIKPGMVTPGGLQTVEDFEITIRDAPGLTGMAQ